MPLFQWTSDLSVNVKEIDAQHQGLIRLINDLFDAMKVGKGSEVLGKILQQLVSYTKTHFQTEERYFKEFDYPDAAAHIIEHKKLIDEVDKLKAQFDEKKIGLSMTVMDFLKDWLTKHIKGSDKKYGPCFNQNGLS